MEERENDMKKYVATWYCILLTKYFEGYPTRSLRQAFDLSLTVKVNDGKILVGEYRRSLKYIGA